MAELRDDVVEQAIREFGRRRVYYVMANGLDAMLNTLRTLGLDIAGRVRAEAVADERQRIEAVLNASDLFAGDAPHNPAAWQLRADLLAAGSVSVVVAWAVRAADGMVYVPGDSPIQAGTKKQAERVAARNQGKGGVWSIVPLVAGSVPAATPGPMRFKDTLPIEVHEATAVAYVRLSDAPVARTGERVKDVVLVDYASDGYPVGIEIHFAGPVATPTEPVTDWTWCVSCPDCPGGDQHGLSELQAERMAENHAETYGHLQVTSGRGPASPVPPEQPAGPEPDLLATRQRSLDEARAGQSSGDRGAFDRRVGEEEAQAELLGHRLAVGEAGHG